jgi:2-haloacid dehalogenase
MSERGKIPIIVFDVNETLLDITTLEALFERIFGDPLELRAWFAQLIIYSQTMTLSGLYTPFGELAVGSLQMLGSIHKTAITASDIAELKERISSMPAHPDVIPSLTRLRDAGFTLVTLSNSAPTASPTPLERAGLAEFFQHSFSVEAVRKFKPAAETYQQVAKAMDVGMADLLLVACHLWDTVGAQAAGCQGALITRPNNALLPAAGVPVPDFIAEDLADLTQQLIQRWAKPGKAPA